MSRQRLVDVAYRTTGHPRRRPKVRHLAVASEVRPQVFGRQNLNRALCGQWSVYDERDFNDVYVRAWERAGQVPEPVRLAELPLCEGCELASHLASLPPCRKDVTYPDRIAAELARSKISRQGKRAMDYVERRAYWCERHRGWHLTSQEKRSPS